MLGSRVRTLCGFQKIGSTFHGYAQSPLFKGGLDVSRVRFHSASTGADTTTGVADTTAGTAVSPKNAERFSENGERFFLATAILPLATADTATR